MRILLVEDNPDLCLSMQMLLGLIGHEVTYCGSSGEALEAMAQLEDFDALITDYYLPDLNGVELIRRTRRRSPGLPAILLTGSPEEGIVKAVRGIPGCRLLRKPIDFESLEKALQALGSAGYAESDSSASASSRMSSGQ